jgi:dihydroorotase
MKKITIPKPFDPHVHFRTGKTLSDVAQFTACVFPRAVVMGNLPDPVDDAVRMIAYRDEILNVEPGFQPIMSIMLTRKTTVETLDAAWKAGAKLLKFIPGGASTGGTVGLNLPDLYGQLQLLEAVRDRGIIFSIHLELPRLSSSNLPVPREIQELLAIQYLEDLIMMVPGLKIVVEHASSMELIEFIKDAPANVAATLTAHHAILTNEDVCDADGNIIYPLNYCKPIAKKARDRQAVRAAMISGRRKFFFGSDSAPHPWARKQGSDPAAGIFSAPVALPLLCQIFEEEGALGKLEGFVSRYGVDFYELSPSEGTVTIKKESWDVPLDYEGVPIFCGGTSMPWKVM